MWLFLSTRHDDDEGDSKECGEAETDDDDDDGDDDDDDCDGDDDAGDSKECGEAETDELRDVLSPAANLWRRQGLLYGKHPNPLNFATSKLHRTFSMIVGTKRGQINCHCFNGRLQCKTTHFFGVDNFSKFATL